MNEEIYTRPKYKNRFIVPVFSIAFFLIAIMSVSYGYFTWWGSVPNFQEQATGTYPGKCVLTTTTANATINVNKAMLMPRQLESQFIAVTNVVSNITLSGPNTCRCDYAVKIVAFGDRYIPSSSTERDMAYVVTGTTGAASPNTTSGATAEARLDSCGAGTGNLDPTGAGCTIGSGTIKVITSGTPVTHQWYLDTRFYYLKYVNQIGLQGKRFWYKLQYNITSCTF